MTTTERKVTLCYKQEGYIGEEIQERFGMKQYVSVNKRVDYDQEEVVLAKDVNKRIKELKSFKNRNYHSFTIKN